MAEHKSTDAYRRQNGTPPPPRDIDSEDGHCPRPTRRIVEGFEYVVRLDVKKYMPSFMISLFVFGVYYGSFEAGKSILGTL